MSEKIASIEAKEILHSRGTALEVTITTDGGAVGVSTPQAGISTGIYEAQFCVDGGKRLSGKGLKQAVKNVEELAPSLIGMEVGQQRALDERLIALDGTPNKARYGANVTLGISLANCLAAANAASMPLYQYVGGVNAYTVPMAIFGIALSGRYRDPGTTRWLKPSYEIITYGAEGFEASYELAHEMQQAFRKIMVDRYGINIYRRNTLEKSYDAFWLIGAVKDDREILDGMTEAVVAIGAEDKIGFYYDAAGGCYYEPDIDLYVGIYSEGEKTRDEMVAFYKEIVANYPLLSIEDPLHEEDFEGHAIVTAETGIEIVGDDLFCTNIERVKMGVEAGAANSMVLKMTQVGTVTEGLDAANCCLSNGYGVHPCGSRGDHASIADFAMGLGAGQVRSFDWRRMYAIEDELGDAAIWPGKKLFKGWRNQA